MGMGTPPDSGWSWVALTTTFLSMSLLGSVWYNYGILLPEWMEEFHSSSAMAAFVGSAMSGVSALTGPITSFLILRWGCRTTHILGGVVLSISMIACAFATSMIQIFILSSLLAGFSTGLCHISGMLAMAEYFKKWRTIAIGVASGGIAFGTTVFPLAYDYMLGKYGWRGLILIMGGICLNFVAFGLVLYPVDKAPQVNFGICKSNTSKESHITDNQEEDFDTEHSNRITSTKGRKDSSGNLLVSCTRSSNDASRGSTRQSEQYEENNNLVKEERYENEKVTKERSCRQMIETEKLSSGFLSQSLVLLRKPSFYASLCINFTFFFGFLVVFGLTPLRALNDFSMTISQGARLVAIMGFSHLFGRLFCGFAASSKCVNTIGLFLALHLFSGVLTMASPLVSSFSMQGLYCGLVRLPASAAGGEDY